MHLHLQDSLQTGEVAPRRDTGFQSNQWLCCVELEAQLSTGLGRSVCSMADFPSTSSPYRAVLFPEQCFSSLRVWCRASWTTKFSKLSWFSVWLMEINADVCTGMWHHCFCKEPLLISSTRGIHCLCLLPGRNKQKRSSCPNKIIHYHLVISLQWEILNWVRTIVFYFLSDQSTWSV